MLKQQETKFKSHDDLAKFNVENCFANQLVWLINKQFEPLFVVLLNVDYKWFKAQVLNLPLEYLNESE